MQDFNREFPDDDACLMYIFEQRWPGGIAHCEKCEKETKHHRVTGRTAFACDRCGWHIYPLAGTIFEKSTTSLQKWFHAMYQMGSTRCGISAKQIQRETQRHLQNRMAHVQADSFADVGRWSATGGSVS